MLQQTLVLQCCSLNVQSEIFDKIVSPNLENIIFFFQNVHRTFGIKDMV